MDKNERCAVCGDGFSDDDVKIYCPDCGAPMHKDCYEIESKCPVCSDNISYSSTEEPDAKQRYNNSRRFPEGDGCEICGKPFSDDDERVYCPDCGAAMHRVCYNLTHRCPYENEHTPRPYFTGSIRMKRPSRPTCDRCGKDLDNGEEKVYCPVCGTPVHRSCWDAEPVCPNEDKHSEGFDWEKENSASEEPEQPRPENNDPFAGMAYGNFSDMIMQKPLRSADDGEELTCRGVKQSELVHFLGLNNISTPRFFAVFMNMANSGKVVSLNISAWFFMPLYHFYRRMTGPAVILTLATFVLMVPTLMIQLIQFGSGDLSTIDMPIIPIANVTYYVMLFMRVILLLFNDYFYMRWSVSKILSMREQYKDAATDEYYAALEHRGNPKLMYVLGGLSLIIALVYMLNIFLSVSGLLK